jgi:sulfoxide reductase heme-binding subunit YedZ
VRSDPLRSIWWLISRASGVVAFVLISLAVLMGLAMAARTLRRPGLKRTVVRLHEQVALTALGAIAVHGLSLLGDGWLRPGLRGIAIPFAMSYRPSFTGAGIIAGYLFVLVGPTFYLRRRIGAVRWRKLHRLSLFVWALSVVHTLGGGSDAPRLWLRCVVLTPMAPIVYLLVLRRGVAARSPGAARRRRGPISASRGPRPAEVTVPAAPPPWPTLPRRPGRGSAHRG